VLSRTKNKARSSWFDTWDYWVERIHECAEMDQTASLLHWFHPWHSPFHTVPPCAFNYSVMFSSCRKEPGWRARVEESYGTILARVAPLSFSKRIQWASDRYKGKGEIIEAMKLTLINSFRLLKVVDFWEVE